MGYDAYGDYPRAIVDIDGQLVANGDLLNVQLENTLYNAADSFEIALDNSELLSDWLRKEQEVKIYLGYAPNANGWTKDNLVHLFTGKIDGVLPTFADETTVTIVGRDYSARMIDTEITSSWINLKSSDIVRNIAQKYGLTLVGSPGNIQINKESFANQKEWDVLQTLADREGFICYVNKHKQLYYGPRQTDDDNIIFTFSRAPEEVNCAITFDDSGVEIYTKVTVRNWYNRTLIEGVAEDKELEKSLGQVKERVIYDSKATDKATATAIAQQRLKEMSRAIVTAHSTTPLLPYLVTEKKSKVIGCGRFSGEYYIERVVHKFDKSGAITDAELTNVRPDEAEQYRDQMYEEKEG